MTDVDLFLEHHGIRGMHWGQRKQRTPAEKRKFRRNLAIGGGIAATAVVGSLVVKRLLKKHGAKSLSVVYDRATVKKSFLESIKRMEATTEIMNKVVRP